jgi:hypothetical protein
VCIKSRHWSWYPRLQQLLLLLMLWNGTQQCMCPYTQCKSQHSFMASGVTELHNWDCPVRDPQMQHHSGDMSIRTALDGGSQDMWSRRSCTRHLHRPSAHPQIPQDRCSTRCVEYAASLAAEGSWQNLFLLAPNILSSTSILELVINPQELISSF